MKIAVLQELGNFSAFGGWGLTVDSFVDGSNNGWQMVLSVTSTKPSNLDGFDRGMGGKFNFFFFIT